MKRTTKSRHTRAEVAWECGVRVTGTGSKLVQFLFYAYLPQKSEFPCFLFCELLLSSFSTRWYNFFLENIFVIATIQQVCYGVQVTGVLLYILHYKLDKSMGKANLLSRYADHPQGEYNNEDITIFPEKKIHLLLTKSTED